MNDFKITIREILFSVVIISIMLLFGFLISDKISDHLMNKYQEYNTAMQIVSDKELFEYAMCTNVGNAFVYGDLKAVDTVSYDEINGEYSYVEKIKEKYTKHYRTVTKTKTVNGKTKTYTKREAYWTWDEVDSWSKHSKKIIFVGVEFDYGMIPFPTSSHIDTIKESSKIRYVYYGAPIESTGTLYAKLGDNTFSDSNFYHRSTIDETIDRLESGAGLVVFWVFWVILIIGAVIGFYYIDNNWLEDRRK